MQLTAVASLAAASAKGQLAAGEADVEGIVKAVQGAGHRDSGADWKNRVLWVDDRPENNAYERQAFEAIGLRFTLALSTDEAFHQLGQRKYAAIISDTGRREGPKEGYVLLGRLI